MRACDSQPLSQPVTSFTSVHSERDGCAAWLNRPIRGRADYVDARRAPFREPVGRGDRLVALLAAASSARCAAGCGSSSSSQTTSSANQARPTCPPERASSRSRPTTSAPNGRRSGSLREGKTLAEIADSTPGHSVERADRICRPRAAGTLEARAARRPSQPAAGEARVEGPRTGSHCGSTARRPRGRRRAQGGRRLPRAPAAQLHAKRAAGKSLAQIAEQHPRPLRAGPRRGDRRRRAKSPSRQLDAGRDADRRTELEAAARRFVQ